MNHTPTRTASWLLAALVMGLGSPALAATVVVELNNLSNDDGSVRVAVFDSADGYPTDDDKVWRTASARPMGHRATVTLLDVPVGSYAISAFHDENDNNKLDVKWFVLPAEAVGASNDAQGKMGPPKFEAARFEVTGDLRLSIRMEKL
jgi:uncharacterized protein (DUF2141 family)